MFLLDTNRLAHAYNRGASRGTLWRIEEEPMRVWTLLVAAAALISGAAPAHARAAPAEANAPRRPNIVWIVVEDMSAHFSCYGETTIRTPNVDRLAAEGVKFERTFVTGPICSISRSALITGMY